MAAFGRPPLQKQLKPATKYFIGFQDSVLSGSGVNFVLEAKEKNLPLPLPPLTYVGAVGTLIKVQSINISRYDSMKRQLAAKWE